VPPGPRPIFDARMKQVRPHYARRPRHESARGAGTPSLLPALRGWTFFAAIGLALAVTYAHVGSAGFIWDDNFHVTRPALRGLQGLWRTWFEPGATEQYYPILHSAFWIEHRLWGDGPLGYHALNILLHALAAFLLYRVLLRLAVPGARLAALVFALHPVCVETVAWVSEQKNTLSAVFFLSAVLVYLRFEETRRPRAYAGATALFVLALLSKSVTATLPAALLVLAWWRRGRISLRSDIAPLLPWFALAAADAALTAWVERVYVGAHGASFSLGAGARALLAGRVVCFYLGKAVLPAGLAFNYPRWTVDVHSPAQYAYPAFVAAALAGLAVLARRSRAPLAAALLYVGILAPALGFVNVYPFVYSYVADHFQYLGIAVLAPAFAATAVLAARKVPRPWRWATVGAAAVLLASMSLASSRQSRMYASDEALWRATIARNPLGWMAHENLGNDLLRGGEAASAVAEFRRAIDLAPDNLELWNDVGLAQMQAGNLAEAASAFERVLAKRPQDSEALNNLANIYSRQGRNAEALSVYRRAVSADPADEGPHYNLGNALAAAGRPAEAVPEYEAAVRIDPADAEAHYNLGLALARLSRTAEAEAQFRRAAEIDPQNTGARMNLGAMLLAEGKAPAAAEQFQALVDFRPDDADARFDLAAALYQEGKIDEAIAAYRELLRLRPDDASAHRALGAALLKKGLVGEADEQFQAAAR
jgi:Flp pilus assembly protein TadD